MTDPFNSVLSTQTTDCFPEFQVEALSTPMWRYQDWSLKSWDFNMSLHPIFVAHCGLGTKDRSLVLASSPLWSWPNVFFCISWTCLFASRSSVFIFNPADQIPKDEANLLVWKERQRRIVHSGSLWSLACTTECLECLQKVLSLGLYESLCVWVCVY